MDIAQIVHGTKGIPDVKHDWEGRCRELEEENKVLREIIRRSLAIDTLWKAKPCEDCEYFAMDCSAYQDECAALHSMHDQMEQALKGAE